MRARLLFFGFLTLWIGLMAFIVVSSPDPWQKAADLFPNVLAGFALGMALVATRRAEHAVEGVALAFEAMTVLTASYAEHVNQLHEFGARDENSEKVTVVEDGTVWM